MKSIQSIAAASIFLVAAFVVFVVLTIAEIFCHRDKCGRRRRIRTWNWPLE